MRLAPFGLACLALALGLARQDPERSSTPPAPQDPVRLPRAPVGADPLPPVPDPPTAPVERRDLLGAFVPPTGFEGFYRLVGVGIGGREVRDGIRGYLAVGRQHLALQILQAAGVGEAPLLQAGFRRYRIEDGTLITTSLVGHDNLGGVLKFEPIGMEERRRLERTVTTLRVVRDAGAWMDFVRVE
jgi:hypothetical protein